ncbi:hypothetical protein RI054_21g92620 [Pseudoscourfieldia marina]
MAMASSSSSSPSSSSSSGPCPSLPPGVVGLLRGHMELQLSQLTWASALDNRGPSGGVKGASSSSSSRLPSSALVSLKWWGASANVAVQVNATTHQLKSLQVGASSSAATEEESRDSASWESAASLTFPLLSGPKYVTRYLRDAQVLVMQVESAENSRGPRIRGSAQLPLMQVGAHKPLVTTLDVHAPNGKLLATMKVRVQMTLNDTVGEFERNEHLAAVDASLPLHPPANASLPEGAAKHRAAAKHAAARNAAREENVVLEAPGTPPQRTPAAPTTPNAAAVANTSDAVEGFFRVVDSFLESQRTRLLEVFRECDKNRDGKLEAAEVRRLLAKVMGGNQNAHRHTIEAQAALLTALLDVDGDSAVSYAELSSAFRGCEAALRWHGTAQARGAVRAIAVHLLDHIAEMPDSLGRDGASLREAKAWVRRAAPWASAVEMQHFVAALVGALALEQGLTDLTSGEAVRPDALERFLIAQAQSTEGDDAPKSVARRTAVAATTTTKTTRRSAAPVVHAVPRPVISAPAPAPTPEASSPAWNAEPSAQVGGKLSQLIERTKKLRARVDHAYQAIDVRSDTRQQRQQPERHGDRALESDEEPMRAHNKGEVDEIGFLDDDDDDGDDSSVEYDEYNDDDDDDEEGNVMLSAHAAAMQGLEDLMELDDVDDGAVGEDDALLNSLFFTQNDNALAVVPSTDAGRMTSHTMPLESIWEVRCEVRALTLADACLPPPGNLVALTLRVRHASSPAFPAFVDARRLAEGNESQRSTLCTLGCALSPGVQPPEFCAVELRHVVVSQADGTSPAVSEGVDGLIGVGMLRMDTSDEQASHVRNPLEAQPVGEMVVCATTLAVESRKEATSVEAIKAEEMIADARAQTSARATCSERVYSFEVEVRHVTDLPRAPLEWQAREVQYCICYRFPSEPEPLVTTSSAPASGGCAFRARARHIIRQHEQKARQLGYADAREEVLSLLHQHVDHDGVAELRFELWATVAGTDEFVHVATSSMPVADVLESCTAASSTRGGLHCDVPFDLEAPAISEGWEESGTVPHLHISVAYEARVEEIEAEAGVDEMEIEELNHDGGAIGGYDEDEEEKEGQEDEDEDVSPIIALQVTRACGMRDVCEACALSLDENTCRLGPNSYVTISLANVQVDDAPHDFLLARTPLVARSYVPNYDYAKEVEVSLERDELRDLYYDGELEVVIWHREFLASGLRKMPAGGPSTSCDDVPIAHARVPMRGLLDSSCGFRGWIALRRAPQHALRQPSAEGSASDTVGALRVCFGVQNQAQVLRRCTLGRGIPKRVAPSGRVRATVFVRSAVLPRGVLSAKDHNSEEQQRATTICGVALRFPGVEAPSFTRTRVATPSESHRGRLAVRIDDCKTFVVDDARRLAQTCDTEMLRVELVRSGGGGGDGGGGYETLGVAEVDLLDLIAGGGGVSEGDPSKRWLSLTVPLVREEAGMVDRCGGAHVKVKVLLEMMTMTMKKKNKGSREVVVVEEVEEEVEEQEVEQEVVVEEKKEELTKLVELMEAEKELMDLTEQELMLVGCFSGDDDEYP